MVYGLYGRLLQQLGDRHLPRQAKQLHARLVLSSVTPSNFLASKLISVYSKTNHILYARHVFDQIPQKSTFSYNAMLIAYSLSNHHADAIDLFAQLSWSGSADLKPDNYSVSCLLKSLSSSLLGGGPQSGKEIHGFVFRHGFDSDGFIENALITFYSRFDMSSYARKVFDGMPRRDVVSWNSMISGYSQAGLYEECKGLFKEMIASSFGFMPNGVTVVSVLQACGQSEDLLMGTEVHKLVVDKQVEVDVSVCNALIGMYAKCGSLDYARGLFDELSERDEVTYGALISGYMLHGFVDQAVELFREMKNPSLSTWNAVIAGSVQNNRHVGVLDLFRSMQVLGFKPNSVTLSSIVPVLSCFSNLKGGKEIHAYAIKNGCDGNNYVATAIVDAYAKLGFISGARRVFDRSIRRSLIIWTAMISAYAAHGDANSALSLFDEMLSSGIQPDAVTFTAALSACGHCGMVDRAWEIFSSMSDKYHIQPSVEHYACMVGVMSREGKLSEATEFVSKMPTEPTAKVWGALLNGASAAGDVELGKFVCAHLFEIEPENAGNYATMANLYSQAGRWKEADKIREKMNEIGLKKIRGSSWIERNKVLQNSVSGGIPTEEMKVYT